VAAGGFGPTGVPGHHDDPDRGPDGEQPRRQLDTGHRRHLDVRHHDRWPHAIVRDEPEGLTSVCRDRHVHPDERQGSGDERPDDRLVVHDQHDDAG
jgi:hypothetical protein